MAGDGCCGSIYHCRTWSWRVRCMRMSWNANFFKLGVGNSPSQFLDDVIKHVSSSVFYLYHEYGRRNLFLKKILGKLWNNLIQLCHEFTCNLSRFFTIWLNYKCSLSWASMAGCTCYSIRRLCKLAAIFGVVHHELDKIQVWVNVGFRIQMANI